MKNVLKLSKFNLFTTRKTIFWWCVFLFLIMTMYMMLFPSMQDMAEVKMDAMPKELLQFVGMEDMTDLGNHTTYFGMIYGFILIAISVFAATFSVGLLVNEENSKSIEFLNSLSVSRSEIYLSKYLTATLGILTVLLSANVATIFCGFINGGDTFEVLDIIFASSISSFVPFMFSSIGFLIAGLSSKFGTPSLASGVIILSYMTGYLGELLGDKADFLQYFSPFIILSVENTLAFEDSLIMPLLVYLVLYVGALFVGCKGYNRRDLKI